MSVYFLRLRCSDNFRECGAVLLYLLFTSAFSCLHSPLAELSLSIYMSIYNNIYMYVNIIILILVCIRRNFAKSYSTKLKFKTKFSFTFRFIEILLKLRMASIFVSLCRSYFVCGAEVVLFVNQFNQIDSLCTMRYCRTVIIIYFFLNLWAFDFEFIFVWLGAMTRFSAKLIMMCTLSQYTQAY